MKSKTSVPHKRAALDKGRLAADLRQATTPMLETLENPRCMESRTMTDMGGNEVREISPLVLASRQMQGEMLKALTKAFERMGKRT